MAKKGDKYVCGVCGIELVCTEGCGCCESELICCGRTMKTKKKKSGGRAGKPKGGKKR